MRRPIPVQSVRVHELAAMLGIGRSTAWRWAKTRPDFPKATRLSARCTVWDAGEVQRWLDAQRVQK